MKKLWSLLALVLVLGLLLGSLAYVKNRPKKEDAPEDNTPVQERISQLEKDKITKMVLTSSKGELVFEKKDKEWKVPGVNYKLLQTSIDDIASSFANMFSEKVVEDNPKDLDKYGLKNPSVTAKAVLSDGTEKILYLGDKTPLGNSYYLMAKDNPKVYTVWMNHGDNFSTTLDELRDRKFATFVGEELNYLKLVPESGRVMEIKPNEGDDEGKAYGINLFIMVQPYSKPVGVDTQKLEGFIQALPTLEIKDFVEDDAKDLSKYGLDKPKLEILAKDKSNNVIHIFTGSDKDKNLVYFRTSDSKSVYTMEKSKLSAFNVEPLTLASKFAYIVNIELVDKIELQGNGKKHTITLSRQTKKAEKEGEEDEVITTYKVDDKEIKEDDFKKYYQTLIGLVVDAENDRKVEEKPEVTTTFYLNKGTQRKVTVNYAPYNDNFYAVFRDGIAEFVITKDKVMKIFSELEALKK